MWLVLDVETTGLDPQNDQILELACIRVNEKTLDIMERRSWVVAHSYVQPMSTFVLDMHTKNGLLGEIHRLNDVEFVDEPRPSFVRSHVELNQHLADFFVQQRCQPASVILIGNSIHFDRAFLQRSCPYATAFMHHRMIDVSSFRTVYKEWIGEPPTQDKAHRAMEDCEMSLGGLRWMQSLLAGG